MDRIEIEATIARDRAWLIETYRAMPEADLLRPATPSEHDPSSWWSAKDHLAHLAGIEANFNAMIRAYLEGDTNPVRAVNDDRGERRPMHEIMKRVHAMTEAWMVEHRDKPLSAVIALGQRVRADTLALLASLSDEQLLETLPGAPWADGTIGGVLSVNAAHGRMHFKWVKDGWAARDAGSEGVASPDEGGG